jgi:hypothetical protein
MMMPAEEPALFTLSQSKLGYIAKRCFVQPLNLDPQFFRPLSFPSHAAI